MVLDSHVHFWKYNKADFPWIDKNMKILQKDYLPSEFEATLKRNNVDGCIAVQAVTAEVETRFLAEFKKGGLSDDSLKKVTELANQLVPQYK